MKRAVLVLGLAAGLVGLDGGPLVAAEAMTLTGDYAWNGGSRGKLEATFSPRGEEAWDVAFEFDFQGRSHVYRGTAKGNLSPGNLSGSVRTPGRDRTFTFSGRFSNGVFRGTHAELMGGEEQETGTLTLRR